MKKTIKFMLIITLIINTIGVYFINVNYDILNLFDYEDFISIFNIIVFLFFSLVTRKKKVKNYNFKIYIIFFIILCIVSSLQANFLFNQGFINGLLAQKEVLSVALLYFPISKIINSDIITKEELYKMINAFALIQLFLFITQYLLSNKVSFLTVYTAERYGEIRYYFNPILLDLFLVYNLNDYINSSNKKGKFFNILWIALVLFDTMIVQKYRLTSIALILIIILGLLIGKTKIINKLGHIFVAGLFSLFMINTRIVQDLILEFTVKTKTYTYSIREAGRKLYLKMLYKHPILGGGYPKSETALQAAGNYNKIYFTDNGIFGFAYIYGGLGVIWFVFLWFNMIKKGFQIFNNKHNLIYLLFPLFFVITCINEAHWYWHHGLIIFILFLILFESEYKGINSKGVEKHVTKVN